MATQKDLESFMSTWNVRFKYDRRWRKKYNISFGSKEHLEANQVDIFIDLLEDRMFEKAKVEYLENKKREEEYRQTGRFLKEVEMSPEEEDKLFKKIKY